MTSGTSRTDGGTAELARALEDRRLPALPEPLRVPVADAHCHLDIVDDERGDGLSVDEALRLGASVGVPRVVHVGCDLDGAAWAVDVAQRYDEVVAAVALHPNEAARIARAGGEHALQAAIERIAELARGSDRVRAIGETGLDFYRTGPEGRGAQEASFRAHVRLAQQLDLALVIHDRDAHGDVLRVLEDEGAPPRTVFHCFSGDVEMARHCAERGWFLSIAGTVTFKNNEPLRQVVAAVPPSCLLVETDAPYLTPVPYRGRPNASYLVPLTVRAMAQAAGMTEDELAEQIAASTEQAFGAW